MKVVSLRLGAIPLVSLVFSQWCSSKAISAEPRDKAVKAEQAMPPLYERFATQENAEREIPDFQKHVSPLLGRLGCNGRACHGS